MLTNKITNVDIKSETIHTIPATLGVALFAGILLASMWNTNWKNVNSDLQVASTQHLGFLLIHQYALVFELLGILLLIALIGAASMARK